MPSSGSCGASTRGVIFNFGYLGTNKKRSTDPDISCYKYPIPDDTPLPFGHRKIMPDQGNGPPITRGGSARWRLPGRPHRGLIGLRYQLVIGPNDRTIGQLGFHPGSPAVEDKE